MEQRSLWIERPPTRERTEPAPQPEPEPPPRPWITPRQLAVGVAVASVVVLALGLLIGRELGDDQNLTAGSAPLVSPGRLPASDVGRVYKAASPGVVSVRVGAASGTGFLIGRDGTIVTNAHVVGSGNRAEVSFSDRRDRARARVLGRDPSSDLAVLRVDPSAAGSARPLVLADSGQVTVGDRVVAIGYPLGLDRTATAGIVSGLGREIQAPNGFSIDKVIQTDAPINPGNSGGPLLDERGRVIGVNSQIATAGARGNIGIGFAVPSNTVRDVVPRLSRGQRIVRPFLGVTSSPAPGGGARVEQLTPGGPAADAGLRAGPTGDVVVSIDGRPVREPDDVSKAIASKHPGDKVRVEVEREGRRRTITVTLGTRPDRIP